MAAMAQACETCEFRKRCITYGWLSPNHVWFPDVVVLCPVEGCRRFVETLDTIKNQWAPADDFGVLRSTPRQPTTDPPSDASGDGSSDADDSRPLH
jgi:hypothetical protein